MLTQLNTYAIYTVGVNNGLHFQSYFCVKSEGQVGHMFGGFCTVVGLISTRICRWRTGLSTLQRTAPKLE